MLDANFITQYQIRGNSIILYEQWQGSKRRRTDVLNITPDMEEVRKKAYSGHLSTGAISRMRKAVCLLNQVTPTRSVYNPIIQRHQKLKLSFITLTISDNYRNYTAKQAYQDLLRPFLQFLTKTKGLKLYIWKAEIQKRGQLHYHLITPTFIHYQEIRDKWNYLQLKKGYLDSYKKKYNSTDPNSTDVHSMRRVKDAEAYLLKYMIKDPDQRDTSHKEKKPDNIKFDGKVWDCSRILKETPYFTTELDPDLQAALRWQEQKGLIIRIQIDFATILVSKQKRIQELLPMSTRFDFEAWKKEFWQKANDPAFREVA